MPRRRRSLAEECEAQIQHAAWLEHYARPSEDSIPPAPAYLDCERCPLRAQTDTEDDRRNVCRGCEWLELPTAPTFQFQFAQAMARFPDYVLAKHADEMSDQEHIDIEFVRKYWQERREMSRLEALAKIFLGGRGIA